MSCIYIFHFKNIYFALNTQDLADTRVLSDTTLRDDYTYGQIIRNNHFDMAEKIQHYFSSDIQIDHSLIEYLT